MHTIEIKIDRPSRIMYSYKGYVETERGINHFEIQDSGENEIDINWLGEKMHQDFEDEILNKYFRLWA